MRTRSPHLSALAVGSFLAITAVAQQGDPAPQPAQTTPTPPGITILTPGQVVRDPRAVNMEKLLRPLSFQVEDTRLENVIQFITDITGADIEPLWVDDREVEGLRKDDLINLRVENMQALAVIERVLRQTTDEFDRGTWQFNESGTLEIGPRSRLNEFSTLKIYDINDLTISLLTISQPPNINLGDIGDGGGGGGGGGLFDDDEEDDLDLGSPEERALQIQDLIQTFVETEQWEANGGNAGTIRYFRGTLLIRAPDYMHRQIDGYRWWTNRRVAQAVSAQAFPDETPEAKARAAAEERRRKVTEERQRKLEEMERRREQRERDRQR